MNTDFQDAKYKQLTERIIGVFYEVYNRLGYGFLEKVYENSMLIEFEKEKIPVIAQAPIKVFYEDRVVGEYLRTCW
jgi:GxxExxY protein